MNFCLATEIYYVAFLLAIEKFFCFLAQWFGKHMACSKYLNFLIGQSSSLVIDELSSLLIFNMAITYKLKVLYRLFFIKE
jgi:hypothetical protein